jgi:hypothetical protein
MDSPLITAYEIMADSFVSIVLRTKSRTNKISISRKQLLGLAGLASLVKGFIYPNIGSKIRWISAEVEIECPIDGFLFGFRGPLELKQILRPGRHHYLDMEVGGSSRIRI